MQTQFLQRVILLSSGICAVVVILLSHSFCRDGGKPTQSAEKSKAKSEITIQAPTDVTAQGQIGIVNHQNATLVKELITDVRQESVIVFIQKIKINFFKTLFRVIISPNAP